MIERMFARRADGIGNGGSISRSYVPAASTRVQGVERLPRRIELTAPLPDRPPGRLPVDR